MRGLWKCLSVFAALVALAVSGAKAYAQGSVQQSGAVTAFHAPYWAGNGVVADGGTPGVPFLNSVGVFGGTNCPFGISSQSGPGATASPYSLMTICQSPTATRFTIAGVNGQATPTVYFNIGGVDYPFPFGGSGSGVLSYNGRVGIVTGQSSDVTSALGYTPLRSSNILAGTGITVTPSGANVTIAATGGGGGLTNVSTNATLTGGPCTTTCTLGRAALTGDITAAGGSNATTLATVNANTGSFGGATSIPAFTVNGKGLITAASSTGVSAALDATFSNTQGAILYRGASAWAALAPGTSGYLLEAQGAAANPVWSAPSAGVTALTNIAALRALTNASTAGVQNVLGYTTAGLGGGSFVYVASDTTTTDNNCTIFVDASSRRWYRQYSGPVNVQWCGAQGDGSTNDTTAIGYALSGFQTVYIPATSSFYLVNGTLTISKQAQNVRGDGPGSTVGGGTAGGGTIIKTSSASLPVFKISNGLFEVQIANMLLDRSTTATSGGNGIDSLGNVVEGALISNVVSQHQYYGFALGPTDNSVLQNDVATSNQNTGVYLKSTASIGVLQWTMYNVFSQQNGTVSIAADGFSATATSGASVTLGTIYGGATFANTGHGYAAYGVSASYPVNGVRIVGTFFGQDNNDEIYLDTYGGYHVLQPLYLELAGTSPTGVGFAVAPSNVGAGINLTPNNIEASIQPGRANGNSYDGILVAANMAGSHVTINGGTISYNGQAASAIGLDRANGINVFGALNVSVSGVSAFGNYIGIASDSDVLSVAGSDFTNNTSAPTALPGSIPNSCIAGNRPVSMNSCGVAGGPFLPLSGGTMSGNIAMGGNNISGGGVITATTVNPTNLGATTMLGALAMGTHNITGVAALSGASATFTGQVQSQDSYVTRSFGLGASPDGTTAHISGPGGGIAFASGLNVNVTGALAVTGNVQAQSLYALTALGVGTAPSVTAGRIDADGIILGSPSGGYSSGIVNAAGTVYGDVGVVSFGAMSWSTCLYNPSATGTCVAGTGTINAAASVNLNGSAYTNP